MWLVINEILQWLIIVYLLMSAYVFDYHIKKEERDNP